jgi:hypothetical protein
MVAGMMLEVQNKQSVTNLCHIEPICIICIIIDEMSITYICILKVPTMSCLEIITIDIIQFV